MCAKERFVNFIHTRFLDGWWWILWISIVTQFEKKERKQRAGGRDVCRKYGWFKKKISATNSVFFFFNFLKIRVIVVRFGHRPHRYTRLVLLYRCENTNNFSGRTNYIYNYNYIILMFTQSNFYVIAVPCLAKKKFSKIVSKRVYSSPAYTRCRCPCTRAVSAPPLRRGSIF